MVGVGPQGDRVEAAGGLQQDPGHHGVEGRGQQGEGQADPQLLQGLGLLQSTDGGRDDRQGCHHDQHAFEAAGEVFGLEMAVVVGPVGRFGGKGERPEGANRRHEIHPGFHRIGEQTHRTGELPGRRLQHDRGHGSRYREQHVGARGSKDHGEPGG